jgi:cytochrome c oxidase subunit 3
MTSTTLSPEGPHEAHPKHNLTGFIIFLCSESVIFLAFFSGYALLKTSALNWLPAGVDGLEWRTPLVNTVVLVSSSGTIALAEHFKGRENIALFRGFWLLSMAMGAYFLYGQAVEWSGLKFGFTSGTFGGTFYLLTGFHGLHVATGILLMGLFVVVLVPQLEMLFKTQKPPLITQLLLGTSRFLVQWGWMVLVMVALGGIGFWQAIQKPAGRLWWDQARVKIEAVTSIRWNSAPV